MKKSKAFSLFEISIVTIVIAVLMAGVLQSRNIVKKAKINNARALTVSSPVKSIGDLVVWYETTLEKSFVKDEAVDESKISIWYDLNPNITSTANNATQDTSVNRPNYIESAINGLPAINFSRSNSNYLSFSGDLLENTNFTVFVVEQRRANYDDNYFIGGNDVGDNSNLVFGYKSDSNLTFSMINNGFDVTVDAYSSNKPSLHSMTFNFVEKKYYLKGSLQTLIASGSSHNQASPIISFNQAYLGYNSATSSYYEGDIGEVIIFKKALTTEERKSVEQYLSKKWNIDLN